MFCLFVNIFLCVFKNFFLEFSPVSQTTPLRSEQKVSNFFTGTWIYIYKFNGCAFSCAFSNRNFRKSSSVGGQLLLMGALSGALVTRCFPFQLSVYEWMFPRGEWFSTPAFFESSKKLHRNVFHDIQLLGFTRSEEF